MLPAPHDNSKSSRTCCFYKALLLADLPSMFSHTKQNFELVFPKNVTMSPRELGSRTTLMRKNIADNIIHDGPTCVVCLAVLQQLSNMILRKCFLTLHVLIPTPYYAWAPLRIHISTLSLDSECFAREGLVVWYSGRGQFLQFLIAGDSR